MQKYSNELESVYIEYDNDNLSSWLIAPLEVIELGPFIKELINFYFYNCWIYYFDIFIN